MVTSLHDLIASNRSFIEDALHTLYVLFASIYASMSKSFSSEVPASILDLTQPLFPNQPDKELRFTLSAGNMQEHPISVTVGGVSCAEA